MRKLVVILSLCVIASMAGGEANKNAATFDKGVIINGEGVIINGVRWATRNVDSPGTFAAFSFVEISRE
ncbi:MAG: hypothetical protein LBU73_06675 [Helicobacteraceae bacterium]|jgi:hypothetical protein|nr:hypothetical protein [Helicobacteraceae bacterium]